MMVLVLPPRCLRVARAPLRGSGMSIGGESAGYSRGAAGDFEGAQPLGLGFFLSLVVAFRDERSLKEGRPFFWGSGFSSGTSGGGGEE